MLVVDVVEDDEADWQSNPTEWIPTLQPSSDPFSGIWKLTAFAPPHCSFVMVEPEAEQEAVCLQVEPSAIEKTKSRSVSKETEICICVMENSELAPQEMLGVVGALLLTTPSMHFDCQLLAEDYSAILRWACLKTITGAKFLGGRVCKCIGTGEPREIESAKWVDRTSWKPLPDKTGLLVWRAVVVGVRRVWEGLCSCPVGCGDNLLC
jgi:hypothetical protein